MTSLIPVNTDWALRLREAGHSWNEVARRCGSTIYLVRKALEKAGLVAAGKRYRSRARKPQALLTPFQRARVRRLKAAGATWKELGRLTGVDHKRLAKYIKSVSQP